MQFPVTSIRVFSQPSTLLRYAVSALAAIIATTLKFYVNPHQTPYLLQALAVAISAQYGGMLPGMTTTVLCLVLGQVFLTDTRISNTNDILRVVSVLCVGLILSVFFGRRRKSEQELLRLGYNLELAQHIANIGSWESDLVTGALWWSAATRRIFGVPGDVSLSKEDFYRFVHEEDRQTVRDVGTMAIKTKGQYNVEHRIVRPDGEVRYVHQVAKIVRNSRGHPILLIGSIQDITERKLADQELRTLRGLLPICSHCKKIRDDKSSGQWSEVEVYVKHHSEANFTHTICPECMVKFYDEEMRH